MRVLAVLDDDYASGWHRIGWPARTVALTTPTEVTWGFGREWPWFEQRPDVVVVQRPTTPEAADFVEASVAEGMAVVVDMDDDLSRIPASNPACRLLDPELSTVNWENAARACRAATLVTVATPALVTVYGAHGRVRVLENCVTQDWLDRPRADTAWVGWPGGAFSHADNLAVLAPLAAAMRDADMPLHVVGPRNGVVDAIGEKVASTATGQVPFAGWRDAVAGIGVGLAPLDASTFNAAKSWLRPLQMAACGVPFVASRWAEYDRLGAGVVVDDPEDWPAAVFRLVRSVRARDELSALGRRIAAEWTYEKRATHWLQAWAEAHDIARSK